MVIACPVTSKQKGYEFEFPLPLPIGGVLLLDQIRSVDIKHRSLDTAKKIEKIAPEHMERAAHIISALIGHPQ